MTDGYESDIELAEEAQRFLSSRLGKRLAELAGEIIDSCLQDLKMVNPNNVDEVRRLQDTIRRHETFAPLIYEIINRGQQAKQQSAEEQ